MSRRAEIEQNLAAVEERIQTACAAAGRGRDEVTLIVVTKTFPPEDVRILADLGITDVGENRDQEASAKAGELSDLTGLRWHCVGQLQTNKAKSVGNWAGSVHSVDSQRLVKALSKAVRNAEKVTDLTCLVQVDLDPAAPPGRGGVQPAAVPELADLLASTPGLELRGVMAVAPLGTDPEGPFEQLQQQSERMRRDHPGATWISAGMSGDLEAAIVFGATHLRVGGAVLGNRPPLA